MAKIVFINSVCNGSTGSICKNLYRMAEKEGHECYIAYGRGVSPDGFKTFKIGKKIDTYKHAMYARLTDKSGFGSKQSTVEFVNWLEEYKPDIIHMHNIHGYYLNIDLFFSYLKKHAEIKKIWTLHDCWSYTGHCAYYTYAQCSKWMSECNQCTCKKDYPRSYVDNSEKNYLRKKLIFSDVQNLTLVTPSEWLKADVEKSYMGQYHTIVINNGIDLSVFHPTDSQILEKYKIVDKRIILGVASVWDNRKGLNYLLDLKKIISDDYKIVIIGLSKKQIEQLPEGILGIERTENVQELVAWYSNAYIFFNPTLEDNYPTVNLEAQACGAFVVAFDSGGTKETIKYGNGIIVSSINEVKSVMKDKELIHTCLDEKEQYDLEHCFGKYIELYKED